jgi:hypothetical protein
MFLNKRLAALAVVIAALGIGGSVASASAATLPPVIGAYGCPLGITNPATGCGPYTPATVLNSLTHPPAGDGSTIQLVPAFQRLRFGYASGPHWPPPR